MGTGTSGWYPDPSGRHQTRGDVVQSIGTLRGRACLTCGDVRFSIVPT